MSEKKNDSGMARLTLILFSICAVCALVLGMANMVTANAIAANQKAKKDAAMAKVLASDTYTPVDYSGDDESIKSINAAGDLGHVVEVACGGSFSGTLSIMVGVDNDGIVTGVEVVKTAETSGLGANANKDSFKGQFVGLDVPAAVTKDGGTIQAITGATITSRAVCNGVQSAVAAAESVR